ncbi:DUF2599 domain-containing protein [Thomasclavelia sp.]|uniref:DUF2599 domain-containing protein n=1 Tax=Thomasclavelia sp. TaxID=3025757 RepID=UPI00257AB515|nr:DUF2599 domain-containing protein [Thomasclavelia sp.]
MIFMCMCVNPVYGNENPSYLSDEEYLDIYNAAYAGKSNVYKSTYRDDKITMDSLRASIKTYTYSEYFKSVKWITRNGVVSLSITPSNKLFGSTYNNNANILALQAATAWNLLYKKHKSSSKWKNTASLEAQFNCHVMFAGPNKVPWNIEPHRTESNWAVVIAHGCNP